MTKSPIPPSLRSIEERLHLRTLTKKLKAKGKRKLGVRVRIYWLDENDRWTALPQGDIRIKRIPDAGTFWQVVDGVKAGVVGVGMGLREEVRKEKEKETKG